MTDLATTVQAGASLNLVAVVLWVMWVEYWRLRGEFR